jgi:hypothetical protein
MCCKFGAALYMQARQGKRSRLIRKDLVNQLVIFRQRQWSDTLYGVVRLLH